MPLVAILGPTCSGKSAVAQALARSLDGEIVSCDSMMVYRGMDVGTAKPALVERAEIPHHLIDICDIRESYNAKRFRNDALRAIAGVRSRGRTPILCGGSGLYARALLADYDFHPHDPEIARQIRQIYEEQGVAPLADELERINPAAVVAAEGNPRRLQRYLEIMRLTGGPIQFSSTAKPGAPESVWVLLPATPELRERIHRRTSDMLQNGWVEETERLVHQGLLATPTASQALGYRDIADFLCSSGTSMAAVHETIVRKTCRFAKRQRTWFRHQHPGAQIVAMAPWNEAEVVARILEDRDHHCNG